MANELTKSGPAGFAEASEKAAPRPVRSRKRPLSAINIAQAATVAALLVFCEYAVRRGYINRLFLAAPSQILEELLYMLSKNMIWDHLVLSLQEFAAGYALSVAWGVLVGLLFVLFPRVEEYLSVFCSAIMAIPKTAILPILILWFGIGMKSKVVLVFLFCVFNILFNTVTGAKQTRIEHLKVSRVFGAGRLETMLHVIIPSALPSIFNGLRVTAATAITGVVFAEMTAAKKGIGYLLTESQQVLNTPRLYLMIFIVTALSIILVKLVNLLEYAVCHKWRKV